MSEEGREAAGRVGVGLTCGQGFNNRLYVFNIHMYVSKFTQFVSFILLFLCYNLGGGFILFLFLNLYLS